LELISAIYFSGKLAHHQIQNEQWRGKAVNYPRDSVNKSSLLVYA